jgi:hypothetical protein
MSFATRFFEPGHSIVDWPFVAYVAFAVVASSATAVQRSRFQGALSRFDAYAANTDATSAGEELEVARSIDREHVRVRIAQAELRALLGEANAAEQQLRSALSLPPLDGKRADPAPPPAPRVAMVYVALAPSASASASPAARTPDVDDALAQLEPKARGEALLLMGDVASLRGQGAQARARWTEASATLDADSVVKPRLDRVSSHEEEGVARASGELEQLQEDFARYFADVKAGAESVQFQSRDLGSRVRSVTPPAARDKLLLAISAADRCADMARSKKRDFDPVLTARAPAYRPTPPTPPSPDAVRRAPFLFDNYQRQRVEYERQLERIQEEETLRQEQQDVRRNDLTTRIDSALDEARALARDGFAMATPAADAGAP